MEKGSWQEIERLYREFQQLGIGSSMDYEKYYLYSLITHSTAIEGSTLTETDTQLLFDEGLTAKGKPLVYHLMNEDLKKAYDLAKEESKQDKEITPAFLQTLNATLHHTIGGSFGSSQGKFRLCGVTAGMERRSYMNDGKIPAKIEEFCSLLQACRKTAGTLRDQYELSFNAHLHLATIHPWVDGNCRTARLLMNYLQFCYRLFPAKVYKEDRADYILSLQQSQDEETNGPFLRFMTEQLEKSLSLEIESYQASRKKGFNFTF